MFLLAEAGATGGVPGELNFILNIIGAVGVPGILAWYLYYSTTVSQPKQLDKWDQICQRNNLTIEKICDEFTEALDCERKSREKANEQINGICKVREFLLNRKDPP